ncbi:MAG: DUF1972 domain-containing protein [Prevotella sp.]|nr:DUF1972 domain-containing protein [Prevotella sp.]
MVRVSNSSNALLLPFAYNNANSSSDKSPKSGAAESVSFKLLILHFSLNGVKSVSIGNNIFVNVNNSWAKVGIFIETTKKKCKKVGILLLFCYLCISKTIKI